MCVCVCAQSIDRALSPAAGSEVMDEAAERYLNPLTSAGLTDRAGRGSEGRLRGLATYHTSQRQQTVSKSHQFNSTVLQRVRAT